MSLSEESNSPDRSPHNNWVEVVMPLPLETKFTYKLPDGINFSPDILGARVIAPFGNRKLQGFICGKTDPVNNISTNISIRTKIKQIDSLVDRRSLFSPVLYKVLCWAADYYCEPLGQVLDTAMPKVLMKNKGRDAQPLFITKWQLSEAGKQIDINSIRSVPQRKLMDKLQNEWLDQGISSSALEALKIPASTLGALKKKGLIDGEKIVKIPAKRSSGAPYSKPTLNEQQQNAVDEVAKHFGSFQCFLLEGLTNSGKTEVYIEIIRKVLARGEQALYLVPEIGLSPQSLERLEKSLNIPLGLMHSALSDNERLHNYLLMRLNKLQVLVGTRSAAFVPMAKPGCIIIDEEHDSSYKQASGFRYNAKHLLIKFAAEMKIPIVLGSATPSLESFHNANIGKYHHLRLTHKINKSSSPVITDFIPIKGRYLPNSLPHEGIAAIKEVLEQGFQALVFINRRGFSPKLQCSACSWQPICSSCDRPMTMHKIPPHLSCHLCERQEPTPVKCPKCHNTDLQPSGLGTQSIESILRQEFPDTSIYRIDRDTMKKKDSFRHFYHQAQSTEPCILVGTQMLAKGHDFVNVKLALIINCDSGLFSNDFHDIENLAQLITQVMGRVGRHNTTINKDSAINASGKIVIPTYNPDNELLRNLVKQGYSAFAKSELGNRLVYNLPPYSFLAYLRADAADPKDAFIFLEEIRKKLKAAIPANKFDELKIKLFGPLESSISKRANLYRFSMIIGANQRQGLRVILKQAVELARQGQNMKGRKPVSWHLDVDPIEAP